MNAKLVELAEHRASLVARVAAQRSELSRQLAPWRESLAVVDQGVAVLRYLKGHPGLWVGIVALAVVSRPRRIMGWVRRGWVLWSILRTVRKNLAEA